MRCAAEVFFSLFLFLFLFCSYFILLKDLFLNICCWSMEISQLWDNKTYSKRSRCSSLERRTALPASRLRMSRAKPRSGNLFELLLCLSDACRDRCQAPPKPESWPTADWRHLSKSALSTETVKRLPATESTLSPSATFARTPVAVCLLVKLCTNPYLFFLKWSQIV